MNLFRARAPRPPVVSLHRRVRELEIVTARLVREGFAGQYHSAFHGRGLEFAQVREYQPGDDIRTIDWNVTARSGVPHVKQFVEERDLTILLALDTSASMGFGSLDRRKSDLAAELVAVLSYAALKNSDRVGLVTFAERVTKFIPPERGRNHVLHIVRTAAAATPRGRSSLTALDSFLTNVFPKRAIVIVLSDFLDMALGRDFARLGRKHDVVAFRLTDPREAILPSRGLVRLRDAETGKLMTVDLAKKSFASELLRRRARIESDLRRAGVDLLELSTATPYDRTLISFFERRTARRG